MKCLLFVLFCVLGGFLQAADKPNIVVILVDDMGFADLGCYGSEIPTPNLDALAKGGVRFTQFYNTGRCCPTRASLLTGLYSHQAGVGHMTTDNGLPGYRGKLNDSCVTIAQVLQPAGYFTAMTGKWHVGHEPGVYPKDRGFDRSLNAAAGGFYFAGGDKAKAKLFLNGESIANDDPRLPKDWYSTDLWTTFGLKFIDEALAEKKPFYLHLCHNAPHFPLQAPADAIAKFRGQYKAGWGVLRDARIQRQREMGLIDAAWEKAPRPPTIQVWKDHTPEEQDRFDHLMAVYAATVHRMDQAIGDLVNGLKDRGVLENTLILFMSDNGGNAESGPRGITQGEVLGGPDSSVFLGMTWATLNNTPFRWYKHFTHEGGISSPLIAHWPAGIPVHRNGKLEHQPAHLIDIMATACDVTGAVYPAEFKGHKILPAECLSLLPAIQGQPLHRVKPIFWMHEGNRAVRTGPWKLVKKFKGPWELYNIDEDRTEQHDIITKFPAMSQHLIRQWEDWAATTFVDEWIGDVRNDWGEEHRREGDGKKKKK